MHSSAENQRIMLASLLQRIRRISVTALVADVVTVLAAIAVVAELLSRWTQ